MGKKIVKTKAQYQAAMREMTQNLNRRLENVRMEQAEAFKAFCVSVLQHAVERAPLDWGDLRGTAYLEINGSVVAQGQKDGGIQTLAAPVLPEDIIHARVVFPMKYALIQHEHPEFHHNNGQAYYLEVGFEEALHEYQAKLYGNLWG